MTMPTTIEYSCNRCLWKGNDGFDLSYIGVHDPAFCLHCRALRCPYKKTDCDECNKPLTEIKRVGNDLFCPLCKEKIIKKLDYSSGDIEMEGRRLLNVKQDKTLGITERFKKELEATLFKIKILVKKENLDEEEREELERYKDLWGKEFPNLFEYPELTQEENQIVKKIDEEKAFKKEKERKEIAAFVESLQPDEKELRSRILEIVRISNEWKHNKIPAKTDIEVIELIVNKNRILIPEVQKLKKIGFEKLTEVFHSEHKSTSEIWRLLTSVKYRMRVDNSTLPEKVNINFFNELKKRIKKIYSDIDREKSKKLFR